MSEDLVLKSFKHLLYATSKILENGKPTNAPQGDWDFAVDALTAMVERRFEVVWSNPTHNPPLHMMQVDDTGLEKANDKAVKFMQEICAERGWDFSGFTMKSIEEYLFCDDPRAGES